MTISLTGLSSMATRALLAELAAAWQPPDGTRARFESAGGVEAARRVRDGAAVDVVVLAADAIDALVASGHLHGGADRIALARSPVAAAVRRGAPQPPIGDADALRRTVLAARTIGYSTGPSGAALQTLLFERWALGDAVRARLVQAPPGVPVGALIADGTVELGFQQLSELVHLDGIALLGTLPRGTEIVTGFDAAVSRVCAQPGAARALLDFLRAPAADAAKRRHGMQPA